MLKPIRYLLYCFNVQLKPSTINRTYPDDNTHTPEKKVADSPQTTEIADNDSSLTSIESIISSL
uniref:Uncharacterized protein n=1 Tax=Glossina palpalis gambiensis TaxID=67801 RepID=A0A1B0B417_9MUSC